MTVITPCYNAAATLARAVHSVQRQTFQGWRMILVDDGSTDETFIVASALCERDRRISVLRRDHAGVSAARNAGVAAAESEWLLFLDADDLLHPRALERLTAAAADKSVTVVAGQAERIDGRDRRWPAPRWSLADPFPVLAVECALMIHTAIVRRTAVLEVGGFDERLRTSEDWDLWQRLARAGERFVQIDPVIGYYRSQPGSLSKNVRGLAMDTLEVMRRGSRSDPRVKSPLPAYEHGASSADADQPRLNFLLWSAARDIAAGGDGVGLFDLLGETPDIDLDPGHVSEMMATGMADYLGLQPAELGRHWAEYEPRLAAVLERAFPGEDRRRLRDLVRLRLATRVEADEASWPQTSLRVIRVNLPGAVSALPAEGAEAAVICLQGARGSLGCVVEPALGAMSAQEVVEAIANEVTRLSLRRAWEVVHPWRSTAFWIAVIREVAKLRGLGLLGQFRESRQRCMPIIKCRARFAFMRGLKASVVAGLKVRDSDRPSGATHAEALARLRQEAAEAAGPPQPLTSSDRQLAQPRETDKAAAWDAFFETDDPWGYGSAYEQTKYAQTLELVPPGVEHALELACAQGHFTVQLARKVGRLTATDISERAVADTARRCEALPNVEHRVLDFTKDALPGGLGLIVCSEVLYYVPRQKLPRLARKIADSLAPGGRLIMAHANQIADDPESTGFDWGHAFGAKTVSEVFSATPGLALVHEIRTPLYRVQAFQRLAPREAPPGPPIVEPRPVEVELEHDIAGHIVWDGAAASRMQLQWRERSVAVPILNYHRVSADGPSALKRYRVDPMAFEAQMRFLRRHGYRSVTPEELAQAVTRNRPLPGRPVMITFDDGYSDFFEEARPILLRHGFTATVFVVTGKVGGVADWDAPFGPPAPLMDWEQLRRLAGEGFSVESHSQTHRRLSRTPIGEVYQEALRSQAEIAAKVGRPPSAFAYPFGAGDRAVEQIVGRAGFALGFTCRPGVCRLTDDPLALPRIEITGHDDLDAFARRIGAGS